MSIRKNCRVYVPSSHANGPCCVFLMAHLVRLSHLEVLVVPVKVWVHFTYSLSQQCEILHQAESSAVAAPGIWQEVNRSSFWALKQLSSASSNQLKRLQLWAEGTHVLFCWFIICERESILLSWKQLWCLCLNLSFSPNTRASASLGVGRICNDVNTPAAGCQRA